MAARKVARWLAPLALVATIAAVYLVVHKTLAPKPKTLTGTVNHPTARTGTKKNSRSRPPARRFYVVKAGDSLSSIAVKTKVSVAKLESFNPKVNPNSLQTGQRLALQR
jgi:LysM repeat protein